MEGKGRDVLTANANSLNAFLSTAFLTQKQQNNFVKTEKGEETFV